MAPPREQPGDDDRDHEDATVEQLLDEGLRTVQLEPGDARCPAEQSRARVASLPEMAGPGGQPIVEPWAHAPRFSYLLKQVERAGRGALDRVARHHSITAAQYTALSVLARHPGMSSAQLGRRSFASPQSANELVVALERRKLVVRRASAVNRRVLGIYLTPAGGEVLEACDAEVAAMELRMLRLLDPDERELMRDLLERCLYGLLHEPGPRPADPPVAPTALR